MEQDTLKHLKIHKIIQLCISVTFLLVYFLLLLLSPSLKSNIYSNKALFLLCALLWIFMIYSFVSLFIDFHNLKNRIACEHALNRKAHLDRLTGIPNRYSCDLIFDTYKNADNIEDIGCLLITISNLSSINETQGYDSGDKMLQIFSALLEEIVKPYGFVGRNGGNEFIIVIENCTESAISQLLGSIEGRIKKEDLPITIDSAYALNHNEHFTRFTDIIAFVYRKLFR